MKGWGREGDGGGDNTSDRREHWGHEGRGGEQRVEGGAA